MITTKNSGNRCPRCKARNNCGWSSVMPDPDVAPESLYLNPCENHCPPVNFKELVDVVDVDGLCRVFEASAMQEIADRTGEKKRIFSYNYEARYRR